VNDFDRARQLADRTVLAIAEDAVRPLTGVTIALDHTGLALDRMSDDGLERVWSWLDSMCRQYPLSGSPLFEVHRMLMEAMRDDMAVEMARREAVGGNNGTR